MEFELIPQLIILFSSVVIIFILGRNISKIENTFDGGSLVEKSSKAERREKKKFLYLYKRLTRRVNKEEYKEKAGLFWIWLEKILRKIRINFLKFDNKIVSLLDELRKKKIKNGDVMFKDSGKMAEEKKEKIKEENFARAEVDGGNSCGVKSVCEKEKENKTENAKKNTRTRKEQEYIELILKNPFDVKSYWKLGMIYSRKKNYKDAISCFRQVTKIDPTYANAKKKITDLLERTKEGNKNNGNKERKKKQKNEKQMPT